MKRVEIFRVNSKITVPMNNLLFQTSNFNFVTVYSACKAVRFLLILALVMASGVLMLHGQGNCGALPPHQANSNHPDSIVYDRFGNTYDKYENQTTQPSIVCNSGYFELRFANTIPTSYIEVICLVFNDISTLIERRQQFTDCGDQHVLGIPYIRIDGDPIYDKISGASPLYDFINYDCNYPFATNRVYGFINRGLNPFINTLSSGILVINTSLNWNLSYVSGPALDQFDLRTVVLHEALHILGFFSKITESGAPFLNTSYDTYDNYLYRYLGTNTTPGTKVIIGNCVDNCWDINPEIVDFENEVKNSCDPNFQYTYGIGTPKIASIANDSDFDPMFSHDFSDNLDHLSSSCNINGNNLLMNPKFQKGERRIIVQDVEKEILCKLGYKVNGFCDGCPVVSSYEREFLLFGKNCCSKPYNACINETLEIKLSDLICNDVGEAKVVSHIYFRPGQQNIQLIWNPGDPSAYVIADKTGYYRLWYAIKGCDCKMDLAYTEIFIGICCTPDPPCINLACSNGFEEFDDGCSLIYSIAERYWGFVDAYSNCASLGNNNSNTFVNLSGNVGFSVSGLCFKLKEPIPNLCTLNLNFNAYSSTLNGELVVLGSENPPCHSDDKLVNRGCTETICSDNPYSPFCISNIPINEGITFLNYSLIFPNFTGKSINYIILHPSDYAGISIDDVIITRECNFEPDFTFINCPDVAFTALPNIPGYEYNWAFGDNTNGTGRIVVHNYTNNGTYTVTLTVTDDCGNTKSIQKDVDINCNPTPLCNCQNNCTQIGGAGLTTKVNNNGTTLSNFFFGCYNICGTLDINQDFNISIATINMGPGARMLVRSGVTLNIALSDIQGCNSMWQGIILENGAHISLIQASISDAQYAIDCQGNVTFDKCIGITFANNYVGIHSPPGGFKNINTPIFSGNSFLFNTWKPFFQGQSPIPQSRTFAGIELNNSMIILNSGQNYFGNLLNGIVLRNSGARITQCEFENMGETILPLSNYCNPIYLTLGIEGNAIYGENSLLFVQNNSVNNAWGGIIARDCYLDARDNDPVNNCIDGIASIQCNKGSQIISNNNITSFKMRGISILDPVNSNPIITENSLSTLSNLPGDNCEGVIGIYLRNVAGSNGQIENNTPIDITGDGRGILLSNSTSIGIQSNTVNITSAKIRSANGLGGIMANYSNRNSFYYNTVNGHSTDNNEAYSLLFGTGNKYCCNFSNNTFKGFEFGGSSNPTQLRGSLINNHYNGLYISFGEIGIQPDYGNQWLSSPIGGGIHAYNLNGQGGPALQSKFVVGPCGSNYWPTSFHPAQQTCSFNFIDWFNDGDPSISCPTNLCSPLLFPELPFKRGSTFDNLINNHNDYAIIEREDLSSIFGWESKSNLMLRLLTNLELLGTDLIIDSFYYANENAQLGQYATIEKLMYYHNPIDDSLVNQFDSNLKQIIDKLNAMDSLQELYSTANNSLDSINISLTKNIVQNSLSADIILYYSLHDQSDSLYTNFLNGLILMNNALSTSNIIQENVKQLNDIILNTIARGDNSFNSEQTSTLFDIANQCPFVGGRSVGVARLLYHYHNSYEFVDSILCSNPQPLISGSNQLVSEYFEVYPNPSKDGFNIVIPEVYRKKDLNIELYNNDKRVFNSPIHIDKINKSVYFLDHFHLNSGIYFLTIKENGTIVFTKKIVVLN